MLIVRISPLSLLDLIGLSGTFLAYGVLAVAGVVFIFLLLPETKGKSLQDIDRELSERRSDHANNHASEYKYYIDSKLNPNYVV